MSRRGIQIISMGWICAICVMAFSALAVAAEDPDELLDSLSAEEEAQVIELIDAGQAKYDAGEFREALDIFNELYELFPHPDVNYRVALCYERLGEDEMAVQHYRQFLEQVPDAPERGRVEGTIATLERRIGDSSAGLRVESYPIGAQIFINSRDTAPVGETPQNVQLAPGATYELIVFKEGYEEVRQRVTIRSGERELIQVTLDPDGSDRDRRKRGAIGDDSSSGISPWKPITTVAMMGFGGVSLYLARGHYQEYQRLDNCGGGAGQISCQDISSDDVEREQSMAVAFGAVGGTALLGAVVFTTWWVASSRSSTPQFGLAPRSDGGINLSLQTRF